MEEKNTVFNRIEELRNKEKLGVTEFLELTSISRGTYYKLKNEGDTVITDKILYKINETFPIYTVSWLKGHTNEVAKNIISSDFLKQNGEIASLEEISVYVIQNISEFKKVPTFKNVIDIEALKVILKAKEGEKINIDKIGQ